LIALDKWSIPTSPQGRARETESGLQLCLRFFLPDFQQVLKPDFNASIFQRGF
jgi:hypothetical protein